MSQRFGHRPVIFIGGLVTALGLVTTGFVSSIEVFFLTYGLLTGIGFGIILGPSLVFPGLYFEKRLAIALGLTSSGSGFGSFIFPNLMRFLMDEYGIQGCFFIMGAIMLNVCACALLFLPVSWWEKGRGKCYEAGVLLVDNTNDIAMDLYKSNESELEDYENGLLNRSTERALNHCNSLEGVGTKEPFCVDDKTVKEIELSEMNSTVTCPSDIKRHRSHDSAIELASMDSIPIILEKTTNSENKDKQSCFDCEILKNPTFHILNIGVFLAILSHHCVFNFTPSLAEEFGFTESEGALCVSIVGAMDLVGRVSSGFISTAFFSRRVHLYQLCLLLFSFSVMTTIYMETFYAFVTLCGMMGLMTGGFVGTQISMLAEELGREKLHTTWSYVAFSISFSTLINPTIAGAVRDVTGSWVFVFWMVTGWSFTGVFVFSLLYLMSKCIKKNT
ncbi:monocarboxylate transporter 9-like isoform X4 [Ostrea edulis]|nr:monocarboxylate transporter 9-like isoform X4 [Ostrea edulis]